MTETLFGEDGYLKTCSAKVVAVTEQGVVLDRTVFYPLGGGQPGDTGVLKLASGVELHVTDTRKGDGKDIVHVLKADAAKSAGDDTTATRSSDTRSGDKGSPGNNDTSGRSRAAWAGILVGDTVEATIDWDRRYAHMRMHTGLHLLGVVLPYGVTGGSITATRSRLDFDMTDTVDKEAVARELNALIDADHPVQTQWITDAELAAQPELIRTMSVKPPKGAGRVRLLNIPGVDLQPCGGTHVARTGEIGRLRLGKVEKKGARNRRVNILFD